MTLFPANTGYTRRVDRIKVEGVVGRLLKTTEDVHHHTDGTLIACESRTYHHLLHRRTKALAACGHANWRKCNYCKEYDDPENMTVYPILAKHIMTIAGINM